MKIVNEVRIMYKRHGYLCFICKCRRNQLELFEQSTLIFYASFNIHGVKTHIKSNINYENIRKLQRYKNVLS